MEHRSEFVGLDVVEESYRQYDKDTVAVQTVGYTKYFKSTETLHFYDKARENNKSQLLPDQMYLRDELVGFDGVEFSFQDQLRGKNGYKQISINKQYITEEVDKIVPPVKGNNVWLTINKQVQMKTEQAIMDELSYIQTHLISGGRTHPEAKTGYAVAMEVDTGKIVAMASMPDYDTNIWGTGTASVENFKKLNNNYMNGTITGISSGRSANNLDSTVLLGSTIKPLSVFIGLREKLFTTTTDYNDVGIAYFGKDKKFSVRNSQNHSYGYFKTPAKAIEMSSNAFMIDMVGNPLSKRKGALNLWDKYMKEFGLGVLTGIDLPNERKGIADYMDTDATGSVQASLVYASFGQGGKYTPLQLAQYTSTLANEGVRIKPQIVSKITDQSGKVIKTYKREVLNTIKPDPSDKAYWSLIKRGMNTKVDAFNGFPYDFARKTGTSQQDANRKMRDNGVFIAYAPRNHPKLAVAVIIPEGGFGGSSAAPIARKIFDAYDEEYGLDGVPKKAMNAAKTAENSANAKSERLQNNESNH
ncbi:cell division protein FtsI [Paenibacillus pini JCM 16418]|uniref:Cell division protein FtsI n=1 Tax=Paenibacillus pini JCM 16418 TaxID=1236976 RepID=W7YM16_9BACL|nr:penicillin-binding transpeptidase domain-containing protein [Paenibacillus pini]GAF08598.1 cell division protein FtsI [Paenibacillus pini JCM 16418]